LVLEQKLVLTNEKMGKEAIVVSLVAKCSCRTKVKMVVVKAKKAITKEVHKAKKMANFATTKLGSAKKLPKMPKGEKEKAFEPLNSKNMDGGASTEKEFSK
jgi:hypothetical protein